MKKQSNPEPTYKRPPPPAPPPPRIGGAAKFKQWWADLMHYEPSCIDTDYGLPEVSSCAPMPECKPPRIERQSTCDVCRYSGQLLSEGHICITVSPKKKSFNYYHC